MSDSSRAFAVFMASGTGRLIRIAAGVFNVCLIAPIIGAPFAGKDAGRARGNDGIPR